MAGPPSHRVGGPRKTHHNWGLEEGAAFASSSLDLGARHLRLTREATRGIPGEPLREEEEPEPCSWVGTSCTPTSSG